MVEKFMYHRVEPKVAGTEYETVSGQVVVGGIYTLDWVDNDLELPHWRTIFAHAHIQTSLDQAQFLFILNILFSDPSVFPLQVALIGIALKNLGKCRRKLCDPRP